MQPEEITLEELISELKKSRKNVLVGEEHNHPSHIYFERKLVKKITFEKAVMERTHKEYKYYIDEREKLKKKIQKKGIELVAANREEISSRCDELALKISDPTSEGSRAQILLKMRENAEDYLNNLFWKLNKTEGYKIGFIGNAHLLNDCHYLESDNWIKIGQITCDRKEPYLPDNILRGVAGYRDINSKLKSIIPFLKHKEGNFRIFRAEEFGLDYVILHKPLKNK